MATEFDLSLVTTYAELVQKIPEAQIYEHYLGSVYFDRAYFSPIPRETEAHSGKNHFETTPSLRLKVHNGRILWKDYGLSGQIGQSPVDLVRHLHDLKPSYIEALNMIYEDIKDNVKPEMFKVYDNYVHHKPSMHLKYHMGYKSYHLDYYGQGGITKNTLLRYNVCIGKELHQNNHLWHKDCPEDPLFVYMFNTEESVYIAYRPLVKDKTLKFRNNNALGVVYGMQQLPDEGETCIITSSGKDVMIHAEIGYPAVANISETYILSSDVIFNLQGRFANVYVLMNNDSPGLKAALRYIQDYGLKPILIPQSFPKDPFDICRENSLEYYRDWLIKALW